MSRVLVRMVAWLVARIAFERLGAGGAVLGFLAGDVLRIRRSHVEEAMVRAGVREPAREARSMYRDLGRGALELLWLSAASPDRRDDAIGRNVHVDETAAKALDDALAVGPVVIGASHTGSWELALLAASRVARARGRRFAVVAKPISSPTWQAFMTALRAIGGAELIPPRGALASVKEVLRGEGVVVMPIDQVPEVRHALRASFLGAPALLDRAPAVVAARFGATFLVTAAHRDGACCRLSLLTSMPPARGEVDVRTRDASAALEAFVRARPASWLWMHRRWKGDVLGAQPPAPASAMGDARGGQSPT